MHEHCTLPFELKIAIEFSSEVGKRKVFLEIQYFLCVKYHNFSFFSLPSWSGLRIFAPGNSCTSSQQESWSSKPWGETKGGAAGHAWPDGHGPGSTRFGFPNAAGRVLHPLGWFGKTLVGLVSWQNPKWYQCCCKSLH